MPPKKNLTKKSFLNIKNFGWPISSYGKHYYKNYSKEILAEAPLNNSHKKYGFEEPIKYFDPSGEKKEFKKLKNVKYCKNISSTCLKADLVIIHTEWNEFKFLNFKNLVKKDNFNIYTSFFG